MGQHSKYSFEMKLAAVTKYPKGNCSTESIARSLGTNYSAETKHNAVCDYLSGKGILREIQKKYGIRSEKQLRNWIMKYNGPENQKTSFTGGNSIMARGRKTLYWATIADKFSCSIHFFIRAQSSLSSSMTKTLFMLLFLSFCS